MSLIQPIHDFLACRTPKEWLEHAANHQDILIIDHANCEKKAAATALNLLFRYVDRATLLDKLSQLAREELLHFEQVVALMRARNIEYVHVPAGRYATGMRKHVSNEEPNKLVDILIVGAFIEARSCERFHALVPYVDEELGKYYTFLLKSESRHFEDYLAMAQEYSEDDITDRVAFFREKEGELILLPDEEFQFHSGLPSFIAQ